MSRRYRDLNDEEKAMYKERVRKYREEHQEEYNERKRKKRAEHRVEYRERMRKWKSEHREEYNERKRKYIDEHREEKREYARKYRYEDLNSTGRKKHSIRIHSNRYLSSRHSKLQGYEIHHCFGYEDPKRFIYIPRTLHNKIHMFLRDHNISADSDHWMAIRELVNSCEQYTYISG